MLSKVIISRQNYFCRIVKFGEDIILNLGRAITSGRFH